MTERQLTFAEHGHILTNINVWSPDSQRIVYDVRSDASGSVFDGRRIETVDIVTGEIRVLYGATHGPNPRPLPLEGRGEGACCGVATFVPQPAAQRDGTVVFIRGPENPTADWQYNAYHREGVTVRESAPGIAVNLDARDIVPPFTPGALRGGTHVHVFSGDGKWVSFTYEDHVLARFSDENAEHEINLRTVGVSVLGSSVAVPKTHPRNHDGEAFSVLAVRVMAHPRPGSDEIRRAVEDAWVGSAGYRRSDGSRQTRALAFQGEVLLEDGRASWEVFVVDLPEDVTVAGDGPLEGTPTRRPLPPRGTAQRRLTFSGAKKFPGIQGPRHWLRSSPDGSQIAFLMRDDAGVVQLFCVSPQGGALRQITRNASSIASAFSWSPDGRRIAHVMDGSVCVTRVESGETVRLTQRAEGELAPRPEACVFSPDGNWIAYVKRVATFNQVFICKA
ncbi:MAG TPA: DUF3748 domain-containing protein [Planctomycetota bacterium]|nr:DUF3748 domain-containing protein [Planctomycetota bacterium]